MPSNLDQAFYHLRNTVSNETSLLVLDALYPALVKTEKYNPVAVIRVSNSVVEALDIAAYAEYSYTTDLEFDVDGKRYTEAELVAAIEAADEAARAATDAWTKVADEAHDVFECLDIETSDERKGDRQEEADAAAKVETHAWVKKAANWSRADRLKQELASGGTPVECVGRWVRRYDDEDPDRAAAAAAGLSILTWDDGPLAGKAYLCQRAMGPGVASRWTAYEVYAFGGVRQDGVLLLTGSTSVHGLRMMPDAAEVCRLSGITEAMAMSESVKRSYVRDVERADTDPVAAFTALLAFAGQGESKTNTST